METRDCVVIGGGPAGSTFAAIVKKYSPSTRVTLLEQARFPRYHIGESTIPVANGVLRDLELYDALLRSSAVKKMGIVFVWGKDRKPWSADFIRLREVQAADSGSDLVDVTGQNFRTLLGRINTQDTPFLGFNVRRAEFDQMLLNQARAFGAEAREGTRVTEILRDDQGVVKGVRWQDDAGRTGSIDTPFVLDASGLSSLLTREQRDYDPHMNNFAVYGYLSNADWKVTYNGTRERSTIFIATVDNGWIWYFPIAPDVMSVGAVTNKDYFSDRLTHVDVEEFWWEMLRSCPEVADLVRGATLRTDVLPHGKRVAVSQDWSSWARNPVGNGWATAGDAAAFVDPILSSGVTIALQGGHRAAYTYNTMRMRPELSAASLWRAYADYVRGETGAFLTLARYFYGNNRNAQSWWWESQHVVNRSARLQLDDHQAFTMATAGFFPTPRAISPTVVGKLLTYLSNTKADLYNSLVDMGVPALEQLARCQLKVLAPFRLDIRTEPLIGVGPPGLLDVFHDLISDEPQLVHRTAAAFFRLPPALSRVVAELPHHRSVASLLEKAPTLVPPDFGSPEEVRHHTLNIVRVAAIKGFVQLEREALGVTNEPTGCC